MKAVRLLEYSGQLAFDEMPTPTIASDEILVRIKSTAVNHLDLVKASGTAREILPIDLPWIPGHVQPTWYHAPRLLVEPDAGSPQGSTSGRPDGSPRKLLHIVAACSRIQKFEL